MRPQRAGLFILAAAGCGGSGGGGGPKVALRFHPPAGAVYHYGLEQRTQLVAQSGPLASMGKQQMVIRMYFTQTVKGPLPVTAGGAGTQVDVVFESMTMEMPGVRSDVMQSELAKLRGTRATIVYDDRGRATSTDLTPAPGVSPELVKQMESGTNILTFGFPDQPVGKGDSWTVTTELPLAQLPGTNAEAAGPAKTTLTVREIRIDGSDTSVIVDIKTQFPPGPIQLDVGGQRGTLKLEGDLKGHQQFSLTRGAILDGTIKGATTMNITAPIFGSQPMRMVSETESSVSLLPDK
ncbi:MAG TPA: hypothetical protein VG454_13400 [Gemmatimonadales bacterium]|nr:hypothetical protein [Gemmatimonadales bacterium]